MAPVLSDVPREVSPGEPVFYVVRFRNIHPMIGMSATPVLEVTSPANKRNRDPPSLYATCPIERCFRDVHTITGCDSRSQSWTIEVEHCL